MKKLIPVFLILILFSASQAQISLVPGKSTERPSVLDRVDNKPFQYEPVDPQFWSTIQEALDDNNFIKMVALGAETLEDEPDSSTDVAEEGKLALAMGLSRLNLSYGASVLLSELAKSRNGTKIGEAALSELDRIAQSRFYDKQDIGEDLLVSNEFAPYHPDIQSFIGYHAGISNLTFGFLDWSNEEFGKIRPQGYWDYQLKYLRALGEISRNHFDSGLKALEDLKNDENTPAKLKPKIRLQIARLKFEQGDYQGAYDLYYYLDLPIREKGRVYLERAWAKFYLKDYGKALGLLAVADSPVFRTAINPERYILEMLIYRELCHYESVVDAAERFRDRFDRALKAIKARGDLHNVPEISAMIFVHEKYQNRVNFLNQIRDEKKDLLDYDWSGFKFYDRLLSQYSLKDEQIRESIDREIEASSRRVAEEILDAEEQITYLDYTAKLDQLRIVRKGENRTYISEKISYLTFDRIFWPIETEHWVDELEDYTMLIKSRCGESQLRTPEELGGGEFK